MPCRALTLVTHQGTKDQEQKHHNEQTPEQNLTPNVSTASEALLIIEILRIIINLPYTPFHELLIIWIMNFWGLTLLGHYTIIGASSDPAIISCPDLAQHYHSYFPFCSLLHWFTSSPTIFLFIFLFFGGGVEGRRKGRICSGLVSLQEPQTFAESKRFLDR